MFQLFLRSTVCTIHYMVQYYPNIMRTSSERTSVSERFPKGFQTNSEAIFPKVLLFSLKPPSLLFQHPEMPINSQASSSQAHSANVIGVHYRVGKKIGEGSFGVIFEGTNLLNNQQVAIKFVCPSNIHFHHGLHSNYFYRNRGKVRLPSCEMNTELTKYCLVVVSILQILRF